MLKNNCAIKDAIYNNVPKQDRAKEDVAIIIKTKFNEPIFYVILNV